MSRHSNYSRQWRAIIGACRPGHTPALPGLFRTIHTHIMRTGREDTYIAYECLRMHRRRYIVYSVVTKYASTIVDQMRRSQVLPGYPHSSAGENKTYCVECMINQCQMKYQHFGTVRTRWRERLSVTNLSSENNLPTFWPNAPVVIRAKVHHYNHFLPDDDWNIQSKFQQVIFRTQVGNR